LRGISTRHSRRSPAPLLHLQMGQTAKVLLVSPGRKLPYKGWCFSNFPCCADRLGTTPPFRSLNIGTSITRGGLSSIAYFPQGAKQVSSKLKAERERKMRQNFRGMTFGRRWIADTWSATNNLPLPGTGKIILVRVLEGRHQGQKKSTMVVAGGFLKQRREL